MINSDIGGSIGIMCVKKTIDGIALFFAHNSDSFVGFQEYAVARLSLIILYRRLHPCQAAMSSLLVSCLESHDPELLLLEEHTSSIPSK